MSGVLVERDRNGDILLNVNVGQAPIPPVAFNDWFLPSKAELSAIMTNLKDFGVGNITNLLWTSSDIYGTHAWIQSQNTPFNDSTPAYKDHIYNNPPLRQSAYIRPVRSFTAPAGTYNLRDQGPAGGWIFYIDGTTFYEAAPNNIGPSAWSNIDDTPAGTSEALGEGYNNTQAIINQAGHISSAAKLCVDLIV